MLSPWRKKYLISRSRKICTEFELDTFAVIFAVGRVDYVGSVARKVTGLRTGFFFFIPAHTMRLIKFIDFRENKKKLSTMPRE